MWVGSDLDRTTQQSISLRRYSEPNDEKLTLLYFCGDIDW